MYLQVCKDLVRLIAWKHVAVSKCMHYMHETDQIELMLHAHYAALHVICVRTPQVCDTDINTMDAHGVNHIVIKLA